MIILWLAAAATPPAYFPPAPIREATHAMRAGRLEQARSLVARAMAAGARGPVVERLLGDLAYASGRWSESFARYAALAASNPDPAILERAGLSALRKGDFAAARAWLERLVMTPGASWEAWNALGVLADQSRDFEAADLAYSRAIGSAPDKAEIANNRGWSFMLRGDWQQAVVELERGHALDPSSKRIANNLELARAASAEALPLRLPSETDDEWAARLNDFGVVAMNKGDRDAAIAAFTQAIEARSVWFERAANNLKLAQSQ